MLTINYTKKAHPYGSISQNTIEIKQHMSSYFVFLAPTGKRYWNDGLLMGGIAKIYYMEYGDDSLKIEGTPLGDKVRRILGIPSGRYLSYDIFYTNQYWNNSVMLTSETLNLWGFQSVDTIESSSIVIDDESSDGELPLIITNELAEQITNGNVTGNTVACPEFVNTKGVAKSPSFDTLRTASNLVPFEDGTGYLNPFDLNETGFINAFSLIPATPDLTEYRATALYLLEYIFDGVETYEDLKEKFYQTPRTPKLQYDVEMDLNKGIASINFSLSERWTGRNNYPDNASGEWYTEYNGVKLNKMTYGLTGSGTTYEVHARALNASDNIVFDRVVGYLDTPSEYPISKQLDNLNLSMLGLVNGSYHIELYTISYACDYTLALQGTSLIQNRYKDKNDSTDVNTPVYFSVSKPYKNTVQSDINESNSSLYFSEKLVITYKYKEKETTTPIPGTGVPSVVGFGKVFKMNQLDFIDFLNWLWGTDADYFDLDTYKRINQNPLDNILSLRVSPIDLNILTSQVIRLGNIAYGNTPFPKCDTFTKITIGTINLVRYYNNYMDFTNTSYRMYLPFVGFVELNQSEMYKGICTLYLSVNADTMQGMYDLRRNIDNMCLGQWECNVGMDLPITSSNLTNTVIGYLASGFNTIIGSAKSITTDGNGDRNFSIGEEYAETSKNALGMNFRSETRGTASSNSAMGVSRYCYIEVTRKKYDEPSNYAHTNGYPCNKTKSIGSISGYTELSNVDMSGIPLEQNIIDSAKTLLESGVYF